MRTALVQYRPMSDEKSLVRADAESDPFDVEPNRSGFEAMGNDNGFRFWWASDLMRMLGYDSYQTFHKAITKAMVVCCSLEIDQLENFVQARREVEGRPITDYKLSRFACYLVAMNGDVKKPMVAKAQAYFAAMAVACQHYMEQADGVDRVHGRSEMTEREKVLAGVAAGAGVQNFAFFQSAGYRGMYNMSLAQLKALRQVPANRSPLDFMGSLELSANNFRLALTEEKIKNDGIKGQGRCEVVAQTVGKMVRQTVVDATGVAPEALPAASDLREVRKGLKQTNRNLKKLDGSK